MKKIHFILPGGGVRGSFQAGFLYRLENKHSHLYSIYHIDGTSIGSINGFAFINKKTELMKEFWFNIQSPESIITPISDTGTDSYTSYIPFYSDCIKLYNSVWGNSVFSLKVLHDRIHQIKIPKYGSKKRELLDKYHCTVSNIDTGELYYVSGKDHNIKTFICASSSLWIVSEPKQIGDCRYIDGGLLENYPTKCIKHSKADLIVLVGYDKDAPFKKLKKNPNMLRYLGRLIDMVRMRVSKKSIQRCKNYNVIMIPNKFKNVGAMKLYPEIISKGFADGEIAADDFATKYLETTFSF